MKESCHSSLSIPTYCCMRTACEKGIFPADLSLFCFFFSGSQKILTQVQNKNNDDKSADPHRPKQAGLDHKTESVSTQKY